VLGIQETCDEWPDLALANCTACPSTVGFDCESESQAAARQGRPAVFRRGDRAERELLAAMLAAEAA
jgi:hypothetical protein